MLQPSTIILSMIVDVPLGFVLVEEKVVGNDKTHLTFLYLESGRWKHVNHTRQYGSVVK